MPEATRIKETQKARLIRLRKERGLCYRCGKRPPEGGVQICGRCSVEWNKRRALHKEQYNAVHRASRQRIKREVFEAYGGARCVCCGESHEEFLTIDHIHGGGGLHRSKPDMANYIGDEFYRLLKKKGYPPGYQVRCMNCNFAKRGGSVCPHKKRERKGLTMDQVARQVGATRA
jgi:hypothetical protein